jgi:NADH dehydrogenase
MPSSANMTDSRKKVVILGGGFAGLVALRTFLSKNGGSEGADITVIDRNDAHAYTPWFYEISTGYLSTRSSSHERAVLGKSASLQLPDLPHYQHIRFRKGEVTGVDAAHESVLLKDGHSVAYDILVIVLGAEVNYFGIPGLPEHCIPLKTLADTGKIETELRALGQKSKNGPVTVHIVGGGPAGVELAAETATAFKKLALKGEIKSGAITIKLLDREKILSAFDHRIRKIALKRFKKLGVEVMEGMSVVSADKMKLRIKSEDGERDEVCDLCIWSGGVKPSEAVGKLPFERDPRGRIIVDQYFLVSGQQNVFAAGDCAAVERHGAKADPQSAEVAIAEGKVLGLNLYKHLSQKKLERFYYKKEWNVLVALGGKYVAGKVNGVLVSGRIAYILKRLADLRYFTTVLPLFSALRVWRKGVMMYRKNDA